FACMAVAQSIRNSKTSAEVVNEKKGPHFFNCAYCMMGRDWKNALDKEDRSQESRVRRHEAVASGAEQDMRVSLCAESVGGRGSGAFWLDPGFSECEGR